MTRWVLLAGAAALLLAGAYWMALQGAIRTREAMDTGRSGVGYREPIIHLNGVEIREIRKGGNIDRVVARQASYRVLTRFLSAEQVTFTTGGGNETIVVEAPRVIWNLQDGQLDLPEGGTVRNGSGWDAQVPDARIDLPGQVLTAHRANVSLPGVQVAGSGLVWRWKDDTVELASPESRISPGNLRRGIGKGGMP